MKSISENGQMPETSNSENVYMPERRLKPRIKCSYPARIQGHDSDGQRFEGDGRSTNLSRNGMYVLLDREIPVGEVISIRLALPTGLLEIGTSNLSVQGTVIRGEQHSEMNYGIAVKFQNFRFL